MHFILLGKMFFPIPPESIPKFGNALCAGRAAGGEGKEHQM